jgi:hypothetical protein
MGSYWKKLAWIWVWRHVGLGLAHIRLGLAPRRLGVDGTMLRSDGAALGQRCLGADEDAGQSRRVVVDLEV